jgi:hypothetical protein
LADVVDRAGQFFDQELSKYISLFGGMQLDLHSQGVLAEIFGRYFAERAPFGAGRDKKHEFPDAAALLSLEKYAQQAEISIVVVSKDEGWKEFAATSSRIYCVDSIQKLTDLFESTSPEAAELRERIAKLISSSTETIRAINEVVRRRLPEMRWILPGSRDYNHTIRGMVHDVQVQETRIVNEQVRLWLAGSDRKHCVAEFPVEVDVVVSAEVNVTDNHASYEPPEQLYEKVLECVEAKVLLHASGDLFRLTEAPDWDLEVDVADDSFRVEPSFIDSRIWPKVRKTYFEGLDDDDDVPF